MEFVKREAKTRKDIILKAMWDLGGFDKDVTTRQIAERTGLNINGLSQTLGRMNFDVDRRGGKGGETKWKLKNCYAGTLVDKKPTGTYTCLLCGTTTPLPHVCPVFIRP